MNKLLLTILFSVLFAFSFCQSITTNGVSLTETGGAPSSCLTNGFKTLWPAVDLAPFANCIELTTVGNNFESSAVWACDPINLGQNFKVTFTANFGSTTPAGDGIAFVLQTEGVPQVKGGQGGGIGYSYGNGAACMSGSCPISPSLAIEFDTYDHSSDPLTPPINDAACDHMSMQKNGLMDAFNTALSPSCLIASGSVIDGLDHDICISWDRTLLQLEVYFDGASVGVLNDNIAAPFSYFFNPGSVYWGFTSAKGPAPQLQNVCNVEMLTNIVSPSCAIALPAESLLLFAEQNYEMTEPSVNLEWTTHGNSTVQSFELQRSSDGVSFQTFATILPENSETDHAYNFTDVSPVLGINYYRIRSLDARNNTFYSNITSVQLKDAMDDFMLFPNPVQDVLTISFNSIGKKEIGIAIYSLVGEMLFREMLIGNHGPNHFKVATSDFPMGMYILKVGNGTTVQKLRFVKE